MRKICVINYKGGTGKTSTVVNLGHALAIKGHKVLIIDTDPQGSAGHHLGIQTPHTLYDILIDDSDFEKCIVNTRKNLDIICSNERLFPAEMTMSKWKERELVLARRLQKVKGYDFILVDCAPNMNLLNQNVLLYAGELMLPVSMEYLSLIGVKQLLKNIKILNKVFTREINVSKVIPTFFDKRYKKSNDIVESLKRVFPGLISTPIRNSISLSEAPGFRRTVFEHAPRSKGAEDYLKLAEEVINGKKRTI